MNWNGGYIFVGLCSCKVYDRYFVPQCFHCYRFNHFADDCPNKNNPDWCAKCSGQHKTENCTSKFLKCLNCVQAKVNGSDDHEATCRFCLILNNEENQIQRRTNYSNKKKLVKPCQSKRSLGSAYLTHIP